MSWQTADRASHALRDAAHLQQLGIEDPARTQAARVAGEAAIQELSAYQGNDKFLADVLAERLKAQYGKTWTPTDAYEAIRR